MMDYTTEAYLKTRDDIHRFLFIYKLITQLLYISYLVYALCVGAGVLWANIVLLCVSAPYLAFCLVTKDGSGKGITHIKSVTAESVKWFKISMKIFMIVLMFYSVYATSTHMTLVSVTFSALNVVALVLQLLCELVSKIIINRIQLFIDAVHADIECAIKPIRRASDFVKRVKGEEPEPAPEPTKNQKMLLHRVEMRLAERRLKKREEREHKKQEKAERKLAKRTKKANKA